MSKLSDIGLTLEQRRVITQLCIQHGQNEYLSGWYSAKRDEKHRDHAKKADKALAELSDYMCWTENL